VERYEHAVTVGLGFIYQGGKKGKGNITMIKGGNCRKKPAGRGGYLFADLP